MSSSSAPPEIRIVIVAATRTGSTWLSSLLNSHPEVRFRGELFNFERAALLAVSDPAAYLDKRLVDRPPTRAVGFKLLYHQARLAYLNEFLDDMDAGRPAAVDWRRVFPRRPVTRADAPRLESAWTVVRDDRRTRVIHLRRRNLLRRFLSHELMRAASRTRWRGGDPREDATVRLSVRSLLESLEETARLAPEIDAFFSATPCRTVFYEDLVADVAGQCRRLLEFAGLPVVPLHSAKQKLPSQPLHRVIENYDEVVAALAGTAWEVFLEAD